MKEPERDISNKLKLVIFDLDGTLVDAYPAIIESFNFTMQKLGYPKKKGQVIRRAVGWGDENLLRPFIKKKDLPRAISIYREHHKKSLVRKSRLYPRVLKVLYSLKQKGLKIAIASNRPTRFTWLIVRHLGLDKYIDDVLCADKIKYIKPHPHIINKIIQHFKVSRNECLFVGDMNIDAQAGKAAGIKTILVARDSNTLKDFKREKPFWIIRKIYDLLRIVPLFSFIHTSPEFT
ncbi:MAG: HAD family hydrolase [Candidatus Omnitrophica bacterium]|nr:HAD family hydrolase [Candidatus Omnitrophota bacterium]